MEEGSDNRGRKSYTSGSARGDENDGGVDIEGGRRGAGGMGTEGGKWNRSKNAWWSFEGVWGVVGVGRLVYRYWGR